MIYFNYNLNLNPGLLSFLVYLKYWTNNKNLHVFEYYICCAFKQREAINLEIYVKI